MQIIKNGDKERLKGPLYFECKNCGCEFKANYEECVPVDTTATIHDGIIAKCDCPCCFETAFAYNQRRF